MPRSFDNGVWTSQVAARRSSRHQESVKHLIWDRLIERGDQGHTDQELQHHLGIDGNSIRPARLALCKLGVVEDSGTTRPTLAGYSAIVWRVAETDSARASHHPL